MVATCYHPGIRSEIRIKKESEILVRIEIIPINSKFVLFDYILLHFSSHATSFLFSLLKALC